MNILQNSKFTYIFKIKNDIFGLPLIVYFGYWDICILGYIWLLGFPDSSVGKESFSMQETPVQFLDWEDLLEKG